MRNNSRKNNRPQSPLDKSLNDFSHLGKTNWQELESAVTRQHLRKKKAKQNVKRRKTSQVSQIDVSMKENLENIKRKQQGYQGNQTFRAPLKEDVVENNIKKSRKRCQTATKSINRSTEKIQENKTVVKKKFNYGVQRTVSRSQSRKMASKKSTPAQSRRRDSKRSVPLDNLSEKKQKSLLKIYQKQEKRQEQGQKDRIITYLSKSLDNFQKQSLQTMKYIGILQQRLQEYEMKASLAPLNNYSQSYS